MFNSEPVTIREVGRIKQVKKSVVRIGGLAGCMTGQLVDFSDGTKGLIMGFDEEEALAIPLSSNPDLKAADKVYSRGEPFGLPVGSAFLGRIVNHFCQPLDGKGPIKESAIGRIFREAPALLDRVPIERMLETGIRIIDSSLPIGKGQRQLVIGDRMTGKTALAVDAILNQKGKGVVCVYCFIGRDYSSFEKVVRAFRESNALDYMIVVAALGSSSIGEQYLAPYTAAALGEYFMHSGGDVLVVFDDLTKHAWAYRELSLLLERPPGREAYPGDIFYIHAQLMERAAQLSPEASGGSMTFLPIADTLQGDIAGFIPTNLISMTDGQVYLNAGLFAEGFKPAIDLGLSVSRIGNRVQRPFLRKLTRDLGLEFIQYRELLKATKLKPTVSEEISSRLTYGERLEWMFSQENNRPSSPEEQLILFYTLKTGVLDILPRQRCEDFKKGILSFAQQHYPDIINKLKLQDGLSDQEEKVLKECIIKFFKQT